MSLLSLLSKKLNLFFQRWELSTLIVNNLFFKKKGEIFGTLKKNVNSINFSNLCQALSTRFRLKYLHPTQAEI
jgi:hypothetical protein